MRGMNMRGNTCICSQQIANISGELSHFPLAFQQLKPKTERKKSNVAILVGALTANCYGTLTAVRKDASGKSKTGSKWPETFSR